jgi:hypothetical protein
MGGEKMNKNALSFGIVVAALLACALPAAAFPPQCGCKYCWENPDSMCLVGPIFFDCVDWYENYCPVSTSTVETAKAALLPFDGSEPCPSTPGEKVSGEKVSEKVSDDSRGCGD